MAEIDRRLGILETKVSEHERRIQLQEEKNEYLNKISTSIELQYKHNKSQDKKIDSMGQQFTNITKVLDGMHTNLLSLNHDVKHVKDEQDAMKNKVEDLERKELEDLREKDKIRKSNIAKIVTSVLATIIGAALLVYFGLK